MGLTPPPFPSPPRPLRQRGAPAPRQGGRGLSCGACGAFAPLAGPSPSPTADAAGRVKSRCPDSRKPRPGRRFDGRAVVPQALSRHLALPTTLAGDLLREKDLHERLIRHVAFVGQGLELLEQRNRQTNRDGRRGRSKVRQGGSNRLAPVEVIGGVVLRPEAALLVLVREVRQRLPSRSLSLAHRSSALVGSCLGLKSPAPTSPNRENDC